jgi:hypothetical protein
VVSNLRFIDLCDRGTLRPVRLCLTAPFYLKEMGFISRFLGRRKSKRLGSLSSEDSKNLSQKLKKAHKIRVRVVDILPKHLSKNKYDQVHVSVWIG